MKAATLVLVERYQEKNSKVQKSGTQQFIFLVGLASLLLIVSVILLISIKNVKSIPAKDNKAKATALLSNTEYPEYYLWVVN